MIQRYTYGPNRDGFYRYEKADNGEWMMSEEVINTIAELAEVSTNAIAK